MSFVHLVPDHHGDGLLGTMLLDYKSVKLYREILLSTGSISKFWLGPEFRRNVEHLCSCSMTPEDLQRTEQQELFQPFLL